MPQSAFVNVYRSTNWNAGVPAQLDMAALDAYTQALVDSNYFSPALFDYGTGIPTFAGSVEDACVPPPATNVDIAFMSNEVNCVLKNHFPTLQGGGSSSTATTTYGVPTAIPMTVSALGTAGTAQPVSGVLLDANGLPVAGVTVTLDDGGRGGSFGPVTMGPGGAFTTTYTPAVPLQTLIAATATGCSATATARRRITVLPAGTHCALVGGAGMADAPSELWLWALGPAGIFFWRTRKRPPSARVTP